MARLLPDTLMSGVAQKSMDPAVLKMAEAWVAYSTNSIPLLRPENSDPSRKSGKQPAKVLLHCRKLSLLRPRLWQACSCSLSPTAPARAVSATALAMGGKQKRNEGGAQAVPCIAVLQVCRRPHSPLPQWAAPTCSSVAGTSAPRMCRCACQHASSRQPDCLSHLSQPGWSASCPSSGPTVHDDAGLLTLTV